MKSALRVLFGAFMVLILTSCPIIPPESGEPIDPGHISDGTLGVSSHLFQLDAENPDMVRFETNDPSYWSQRGYSIWVLNDESPRDFVSFDVTLSKTSGDQIAGYGVIANYYDDPDLGEVMLVLMINNSGEYTVAEIVSNVYTPIIPWTLTDRLSVGYNQPNRVVLDFDGDQYRLSINGEEETLFEDTNAPTHEHGIGGYAVVISNLDDFPTNPVKVVFVDNSL
jgi:hypothetical protein